MSKNDDILKNAIGDIGDEEPKIGGKLKNMKIVNPNLLDEDEKKSMDEFLQRSERAHVDVEEETSQFNIANGWIPIDREEMGLRSDFYPSDWQFRIKPADVAAIKSWSSIDEERIDVVNNVFNEIMKLCVSIRTASGVLPWSKINSWDRFWFILKIREFTFPKGDIKFNDNCTECDTDLTYVLRSNHLYYDFPDEDVIQKHWNAQERYWYINPQDYDINENPVILYTPTLEKDQAILDWAVQANREGKKLDDAFLRFLPWLLQKAPKDVKILNKFILECENKFKKWDMEMFNFMDEVLRNIIINPEEKLEQTCPHCGEAVRSTVKFPMGIKHLFAMESGHKKFGSK